MKLRSTLILLLIAAGFGAYIYLVEIRRPNSREAQEQSLRVVKLDRDDIDAVTIKNSETTIELHKKNGAWELEAPLKDRADSMVLHQLFTTLETLRHDAIVNGSQKFKDKSSLKEFGLASSETRVKFTGSGQPVEVLIGKDAAVEGKIYARLDDANTVYVIGNDLKNQITRKIDDFRDRKLSDLNPAEVQRFMLKTAAGEIECEKKNGHWALSKPLKARGDDAKIGDFVAQSLTAHVDAFVGDSANLAAYGLQEPRGTLSFYSEGTKDPVVLQIGSNPPDAKEKDKEKTYAKLSTREAIVVLPNPVEKLLATQPNDLRDKNLMRFEADIVDRLNIEAPGKAKIVLARQGEGWLRKGEKDQPANANQILNLLSQLKSQTVDRFVADIATDLPKYGLDQPQIKLTLSSYASENTSETKAGEKPIVSLLLGKIEDDRVYAMLDDEPFIVALPTGILEEIFTDPLQWQPVQIFRYKPEEITALEITRAGQSPISLERDKDKWKLTKGDDKAHQINVQSLVNTLSTLRAFRWLGAAKPEQGLEPPAITITFRTSSNSTVTLKMAAESKEHGPASSTSTLPGIFEMAQPDRSAFEAPLIDRPTPVAAPALDKPAPTETPQQ